MEWFPLVRAVTHSEIASSPLVKKYGKVLSDAAAEIGSPQIRNLGTIGGNIINASPAADTIPPLMVLDAVGKVVSKGGEREVPLIQLFKGPYETNLKPYEILVHVVFKKLLLMRGPALSDWPEERRWPLRG